MLNRSLSLSDFPVEKPINFEKHKSQASGPLVKYYSCEEILYNAEKIKIKRIVQEFSLTRDNISSWKSWAVKYEGPVSSLKQYCKNLDTPSSETDLEPFSLLEKKDELPKPRAIIRPLSLLQSISRTDKRNNSVLFVILPIIFVITAIIACSSLYLASNMRVCEMPLDVVGVKSVLETSIFGQDAIYEIISTLDLFCSSRGPGIVIMALAGGTGVGKTYTTSIISDLFPWEENVQHFVLPLHSNSLSVTDVYAKFSTCGDNLVIMDGLIPSDAVDVTTFLQKLMKYSQDGGMRVIVILVFSNEGQKMVLQGYGDSEHQLQVSNEKLCSVFQEAGLEVSLITFQTLQMDHIVMCIKEAVSQKGIVWSSTEIDRVINLLPHGTGCKGVASKVQLFIDSGTR